MDMFSRESEDIPHTQFTIIRDDIDIGKKKITNIRRTASLGSEVDTLLLRLRRLEEAQRASKSHLKGSVDKSRDTAKVHFADSVTINFYKQEEKVKVSSCDEKQGHPSFRTFFMENIRNSLRRSTVEDETNDYLDNKRVSIQVKTPSIGSEEACSTSLKSVLKMQKTGCPNFEMTPVKCLRSQDSLYGMDHLPVESEVDAQCDSEDENPSFLKSCEHEETLGNLNVRDVNSALDVPQDKKRSLLCFLCCRGKSKKHKSYHYEQKKNVQITSNTQSESSSTVSEPPSATGSKFGKLRRKDLQKIKYFRDHRKPSTDQQSTFSKFAHFLTGR